MAGSNGPRIVTNGLYLCYDFADKKSYPGSGNTVTNLSNGGPINKLGTDFNGVIQGGSFDSGNGGRFYANTPSNYATRQGIIPNNKPKAISRLTCEAWAILLYPNRGYVSENGVGGAYAWGWGPEVTWRCLYTESVFQFTMSTTNNLWFGQTANFSRTRDDNWHHYVCVYDGTNAKIYVDGVLVSTSGALSGNISTQYNADTYLFYAGGNIYDYGKGYLGYYAEHEYAFTAAEVLRNFNAKRRRFGI